MKKIIAVFVLFSLISCAELQGVLDALPTDSGLTGINRIGYLTVRSAPNRLFTRLESLHSNKHLFVCVYLDD